MHISIAVIVVTQRCQLELEKVLGNSFLDFGFKSQCELETISVEFSSPAFVHMEEKTSIKNSWFSHG